MGSFMDAYLEGYEAFGDQVAANILNPPVEPMSESPPPSPEVLVLLAINQTLRALVMATWATK